MAEETMDTTARYQAISKEASRVEEDATLSAKGHFEASRLWGRRHLWIGIPNTMFAAIAGVSILAEWWPVASGVLALTVAALSALFTFLDPRGVAASHSKFGNAYKALQNDTRVFREIECHQDKQVDELVEKLNELNDRRNSLNEESPQIPRGAFERAKRGVAVGEASYAADK